MKKYLFLLPVMLIPITILAQLTSINIFSQSQSFDVFTYQSPEFFTKSELSSRLHFNLTNNDTSFCSITLYKSMPAKADIMKDIVKQWNDNVIKRLSKADKKPGRIYTEQMLDSWTSTLAIGNFYQNKKKCVVMMNSFRKNKMVACVVFAFSDKLFKGPIEIFSENLHLVNQ